MCEERVSDTILFWATIVQAYEIGAKRWNQSPGGCRGRPRMDGTVGAADEIVLTRNVGHD